MQIFKKLLWLLLLIIFIIVGWRLVNVHCKPDPRVVRQSQRQYWLQIPFSANRGDITDTFGKAFSLSIPSFSFFIDPLFWDPQNTNAFVDILNKDILNKINKKLEGRFFWLIRRVDENTANAIRAKNIDGIYECKENLRIYPNNNMLAHVLGYCDIEGNGLSGMELIWNKILYSPSGVKILAKASTGGNYEIVNNNLSKSRLRLTIDSRMQYFVEQYLDEGVRGNGARWGAVVCLDVDSGAIRAVASWPTFNPNHREDVANRKLQTNNALGRTYEPGSTLKPVICAIALERGAVRRDSSFYCPQRIRIADGYISDHTGNGTLNVNGIIVKSSNVGMAQIGMKVKPFDMYNSLREWGFGLDPNVEINGVEEGLIASPELWRGVIPSNIAIGQGLAVTPLQLVSSIAAIANQGVLLRPYLVEEAIDSFGRIVYKGGKTVVRTVLSPPTASWITHAMRDVVTDGTGKSANSNMVEIAGKTGTAEVAGKGSYLEGRWVSSFIGFWPFKTPRYAMIVVIGEPTRGKYYGAEVAAPIFRKIVEETLKMNTNKEKYL